MKNNSLLISFVVSLALLAGGAILAFIGKVFYDWLAKKNVEAIQALKDRVTALDGRIKDLEIDVKALSIDARTIQRLEAFVEKVSEDMANVKLTMVRVETHLGFLANKKKGEEVN